MAFDPLGLAIVGLVVGLHVGSFLNVVIHRVPRGESVVRPRSRCPACGNGIAFYDNVPVLSWLMLGGRCRHCQAPISFRYPLVELVTGAVFAGIAAVHGASPMTVLWWGFAAALIAGAGIDYDERWIPDEVSVGGLVVGLVAVPFVRFLGGMPYGEAALVALGGALLGGGALWLVGFAHARLSVALGREFEHWPGEGEELPRPGSLDYWVWFPGLGFGDVKLMAMVGAFFGPVGVAQVVFLAALIGVGMGVVGLLRRGGAQTPFGFGPAIAVAAVLLVLAPRLALLPI